MSTEAAGRAPRARAACSRSSARSGCWRRWPTPAARSGCPQLAAEADLPLPTIHRLVRTLVDLGYVRQEPSRQYALGSTADPPGRESSKMLGTARPLPARAGRGPRRVGQPGDARRRPDRLHRAGAVAAVDADVHRGRSAVSPHCTAVGKAILARMPPGDVRELFARTGMPRTPSTPSPTPTPSLEPAWCGEHGYAIDDGEQELGVRCVAVAVPGALPARHVGVRSGRPDDRAAHRARGAAADRGGRRHWPRTSPRATPNAPADRSASESGGSDAETGAATLSTTPRSNPVTSTSARDPASEHVDVLIVGAGLSGIGAAYRLQTAVPRPQLRRPRGARGDRRHLGPVPLPRGALGLRHVHPRLPVQAVDGREVDRRRRQRSWTTSTRPPPSTASRSTSATAPRWSARRGPAADARWTVDARRRRHADPRR